MVTWLHTALKKKKATGIENHTYKLMENLKETDIQLIN